MASNHCNHVKEDGTYCQRLPLHKRRFCYYHLRLRGRQVRMARERARLERRALMLPPMEDLHSINAGLEQLKLAIAFEHIDRKTAWLLSNLLHQAASNLKFMQTMAANSDAADNQQEQVDEYPGFEAEFGLPEDFDLEQSPEVAFPRPATITAEPSPYRSSWERYNPEDIELEEILETQGEEPYKKRLAQLDMQSWKQRQRDKRKLNEARWIIEAHRRTYEKPPQRTPEEQRAYDLKVIADFNAKYPPPVKPEEKKAVANEPGLEEEIVKKGG